MKASESILISLIILTCVVPTLLIVTIPLIVGNMGYVAYKNYNNN